MDHQDIQQHLDAWHSATGSPPPETVAAMQAMQARIAEETRKAVLGATRRFLERVDVKALDELRKELDLPAEALGALIEIHAKKLAESEMSKAPRASREVLPFCTKPDLFIKPGQSAEITARPQRLAFRPERFFVSDGFVEHKASWWRRLWHKAPQHKGSADWLIDDIKIGNRSQFSQAGSVPADMFRSTAIDSFVSFETAQTAMDIKIVVTYVGSDPKGQPFFASLVGTAAI
jgi:hypothetical protein